MTRRDYRSFSKAASKLLAPGIEPLGFQLVGSIFVRRKPRWLDVISLQQSQFGSGAFCVNLGLHVPTLERWWQLSTYDPTHLAVAVRLSLTGVNSPEHWFAGTNTADLQESMATVASCVSMAEPWFARVNALEDIASLYAQRNGLSAPTKLKPLQALSAINYAFLLAEAGHSHEARDWLTEARQALRKSGVAASYEKQLVCVSNALSMLAAQPLATPNVLQPPSAGSARR